MPHPGGYENTVEIHFEALDNNETLVKIIEGTWKPTQDGLHGSYQNFVITYKNNFFKIL